MKLDKDPRLPMLGGIDYERAMYSRLYELFRQILNAVSDMSEGKAVGYTALPSPPTTGEHYQGDQIRNSQPTASGGIIVLGWVCVQSGKPGVWKEIRCQTN